MADTSTIVISIITFLIGAVIGTGGLWEWNKLKMERFKHERELRIEIEKRFYEIIKLSNMYAEVFKEALNNKDEIKIN